MNTARFSRTARWPTNSASDSGRSARSRPPSCGAAPGLPPAAESSTMPSAAPPSLEGQLVIRHHLGRCRARFGVAEQILGLAGGAGIGEDLQPAGEAVEHDLGGEDVAPVLLPAAGAHLAFDGDEGAALGPALEHVDELVVPDDDAVPLRPLLPLDVFGGGEPERGDPRARGRGRGFGIAAEPADGDETLIHDVALSLELS